MSSSPACWRHRAESAVNFPSIAVSEFPGLSPSLRKAFDQKCRALQPRRRAAVNFWGIDPRRSSVVGNRGPLHSAGLGRCEGVCKHRTGQTPLQPRSITSPSPPAQRALTQAEQIRADSCLQTERNPVSFWRYSRHNTERQYLRFPAMCHPGALLTAPPTEPRR